MTARVRPTKRGRDHLIVLAEGTRTLCGLELPKKLGAPRDSGIVCTDCRRRWRTRHGDKPPPGYPAP